MHPLNKIVVALLLLGPLQGHGSERTPDADLLNAYLSAITTLSAGFEQNTTDQSAYDTTYDTTEYNGRLWMEKPNRFRL